MFHGHLDYFHKTPLQGRPNRQLVDHGTPNAHNGVLSEKRILVGRLLVDIGHYLFVRTRSEGWTEDDLNIVQLLFQKWRIYSEALDGPNGRPLEHVVGAGHILEDVRRFGHSDVYWCFPFEREVQKYQNIKTNQKSVETTFIKYCSRILFQKVKLCMQIESDGLEVFERALARIHDVNFFPEGTVHNHEDDFPCPPWHRNCCLHVTSKMKALDVYKFLLQAPHDCACVISAKEKGILISKADNKHVQASSIIWSYLRHHIPGLGTTHSPQVLVHKRCMLGRTTYKAGDDVVVINDEEYGTPYKGRIREIFSHEYNKQIEVYFFC
jgi:hypothetical protein